MTQVSRPLLIALAAAVLFLGVWIVALKPSSSGGTAANPHPSAPGVHGLANAVNKAHAAVAQSNDASAAHGGTIATPTSTLSAPPASTPTTPTTQSTPTTASKPATPASPGRSATRATKARLNVVTRALADNKVLALLFYNPAGPDDRAVKRELASIPVRNGWVVKLAVPLSELGRYPVVTTQVGVNESPTLVVINRAKSATEIIGFADAFEIGQRIDDAVVAA